MNWTGKYSVFFVTVFALVLTGLFAGTARAEALGGRSGEESAFFYPSFPTEGGPYVVAASYWDASDSDTSYVGETDSLFVVFNEPISVPTVDIADFVPKGFEATTLARVDQVTYKFVVLTGLTNVTVNVDSLRIIWDSIDGDDGSASKDIGYVPITKGPVLVDAEVDHSLDAAAIEDLTPNQQTLTLTFDHPVDIADAANIFKSTPELSASGILLTKVVSGRVITVTRNVGSTANLRWLQPGISKIYLDTSDIYWSAWTNTTGLNTKAQKVPLYNQGPTLLAAYYNDKGNGYDADDEVWLVFTEAVPEGGFSADHPDDQYDVEWGGGAFGADATQARQPAGADYASTLVIRNPSAGDIAGDGDYIVVAAGEQLNDYQGVTGRYRQARTTVGVGITRAAYFDRGTDDPADDELHIWFSQQLDLADVTALDFAIYPAITDFWTLVTVQADNTNGLGRVVINGFDLVPALNDARLPNGYLVKIAADDAFDGLDTPGEGCDGSSYIPILDDSKPARIDLAEVTSLTYKRYNTATAADTAFLAWKELPGSPVDDGDQYFLFFTNQPAPMDQQFIENWRQNALAVGNLTPLTIDTGVQRCAVNIDTFQVTTDQHPIAHGDQLRFMLVPATYWTEMADGTTGPVLKFTTPIIAGPVCPPQDFDEDQDDIIHVTAVYDPDTDSWTHSIYGDEDAAPCGSRVYIYDGDDWATDHLLGWGPIESDGSFEPIELDTTEVSMDDVPIFYIFAWDDGAYSDPVEILNDRVAPTLDLTEGLIENADRFNPYRIYKANDYINILAFAIDWSGDPADPDTSLSDLLELKGDFSYVDDRTLLPPALGGGAVAAVDLVSLGNDNTDNDNDWVADDPLIDLDTDGIKDYPEPFCDENGNGWYNAGETFVDQDGDDLCDAPRDPLETVPTGADDYDLNLDSADPDEHGWYEVRLLAPADDDRYDDAVKGFELLDPVTDPQGQENFGEILDLPVPIDVRDTYLDQTTEYDEDGPNDSPFECEVDEVAPSVAKIDELFALSGYTEASVPGNNLIIPTDPTYHLGRFFNFQLWTPSDEDVLFGVTHIRKVDGTWVEITTDPAGHVLEAGIPGITDFDDDRDGADALASPNQSDNGIDDDEDGVVDNEGEGTDLLDAEVKDASQDSTLDANAGSGGDLIYRVTDSRDNDNDAFFLFEPYYDPGAGEVLQKVVWFNIDERTDNDIDDDYDGYPDDVSGHGPGEVETYDAQADDNEDGIVDGEAVEVDLDGVRMFAVKDSTGADSIWVDAAHVLGEARTWATAYFTNGSSRVDYEDIRELTEFVTPGYGVLDPNGILVDGTLPGLPWGDDQPLTNQAVEWFATHDNTNIDFWQIAQITFDEVPDGVGEYQLRAVAYDQAGNVNENYAVPVTFTSDVTAPNVNLTNCLDVPQGYPEDFLAGDVRADEAGIQLYNEGIYTLTVENIADADSVFFQSRISTDGGLTWQAWTDLGADGSQPFVWDWNAADIVILDTPPDYSVLVEFRAWGKDEFQNEQDPTEACSFQVKVMDGTAPVTWFTLIHETANPNNDIPDVMNPPDTGSAPYPYYYRDVIGPLQVPRGPAIDIWALFSPHPDSLSTTEHDVIRVVFEISLAGSGIWTPFATVTGHVDDDDHTIDLTLPVAVTLETEALETGTYDIRVYSCDIEGNNCTPADEAPTDQFDIAKITIVEEGLRAYIQPVLELDCERQKAAGILDLFAINWIHDYWIDHVLFQYYADTDGDGVDNDGGDWVDIATDDVDSGRGDIVLRRGSDLLDELTGHVAFDSLEAFIDYDGDGYSERDPIIREGLGGDLVYDAEDDTLVLGGEEEIEAAGLFTLTPFADDEFHTGDGFFDPTEWVFRDNGLTGHPAPEELNLWNVQWNVGDIDEGTYLLRAVATDEVYAVDDTTTAPTVIPTVSVSLDQVAPMAEVSTITLSDGTEEAAVDGLYVPGEVGWVKVCATSADTDLSYIKLQFRIPGHATFDAWHDLDVNDDADFYAEIDGIPGLTAEDEIFLDSGTVPFVYDSGDQVLYMGANGVLNADDMTPAPALFPMSAFYTYNAAHPAYADTTFEEDGVAPNDDDHDGMSNEDLFNAHDWYGDDGYCVYIPITPLGLISDSNVELRAIAFDQSCNADSVHAPVVQVIFGETDTPETDVVWVKLASGEEIDFLPTLSDSTDVTQLDAADIADPVTVMVTGEDETALTQVDLMYRRAGDCYDLMEWENPWRSMSTDGYTTLNTSYDYPFTVDLAELVADHGYGVYEFYAQATDNEGNVTPVQEVPYRFKIMTNEALITSTLPAQVAPGDEVWFSAALATPDPNATVTFLYAERLIDIVVDATRITPDPDHATFQTMALANAMIDPGASAILTIDAVKGDYFATWEELLASGGEGDWTYDAVNKTIEFKVRPDAGAEILVSYNVTAYDYLWGNAGEGSWDNDSPYTAAWDQQHNAKAWDDPEIMTGVPGPLVAATDAYEVIAVVTIGDADADCDLAEAAVSEGKVIDLISEDVPDVDLYARGLRNADPWTYWPGNPSFDTIAGLTEWKLSGIEHEFFVVTDPVTVDEVNLIFATGDTDAETVVPMTQILTATVPMTFTLYESDFPDVRYGFENVGLDINGGILEMTEVEPGIWQVSGVPVATGATTPYLFAIDQDGNDWDDSVPDPRNMLTPPGPFPVVTSSVKVPPVGFWFATGADVNFGLTTEVWRVRAEATITDPTLRTELTGIDGPFAFVYDPVPPTVDEVTATSVRFKENTPITVYAMVTDPVPADFNVITVSQVTFQYCPNYAVPVAEQVWLPFGAGTDTDRNDGWSMTATVPDPQEDGFDNDGDGVWDEPDEESTAPMAWRVFAMDDGHNNGPAVVLPFTLDSTEPAAVMTAPAEGSVFPFGSSFNVSADVTESEGDIAYVQFWGDAGDGEFEIDITPEDDSDHPFDTTAPYEVVFNTADYLDETDTYVRLWAQVRDEAGNDGMTEQILIVVDDVTGPTAYPLWAKSSGAADYTPITDPHLAVNGHSAMIKGTAIDPSGRENLAWVRVQYEAPDADAWTDIAIVDSTEFVTVGYNDFTVGWSVTWDVVDIPDGTYNIRAIAGDEDGNADPDPIVATLRVDHTDPEVLYAPIAGFYDGFTTYRWYQNDDNDPEPDSSMAITPDPETHDLAFRIVTRDDDIASIRLELHQDGTDDLGEWHPVEDYGLDAALGAFDFEPGLTFESGGETYYVWWLRIDDGDDYTDDIDLSGPVEVRALATDYAGNRNILHDAKNNWSTWTLDTDDPYALDFHHNLDADQVASGDPVTFGLVLSDSTTDVAAVRLEYKAASAIAWTIIDPNPATEEIETIALTPENLDTEFARWTANVTWITPYPVVVHEAYAVRATFFDTVGHGAVDSLSITVEDNIKPEFTKIWAIPAVVSFVDDPDGSALAYDDDCEDGEHDGLFIDFAPTGTFQAVGSDVAIDYGDTLGAGHVLVNGAAVAGTIGDANATWPRYIDEIVLGGELDPIVSRIVTLVARTQIHDTGLERVEFYAVNDLGDRILVGTDECVPVYGLTYFWHVIWNTEATDEHGDPIYPDGVYDIVPIAYDLEGNVEDWPASRAEIATVTVDNTAPLATADADPSTEIVDPEITIERNDVFTLFARTESERDDDIVTFYTKREADLNMVQSWTQVPLAEGLDASDANPDSTRPYVFDWDLDKMDVPFPLEDPVVGVRYNMAATGEDIVANDEAVTDAFAGGRFITFTVRDTRWPVATITQIERVTGDTTPIVLPHEHDPIHARDLAYLRAKILDLDNDVEKVEFMYALPGEAPSLIDGDVVRDPLDPFTWEIGSWDLSPLAGQTIEVFAVATDDVGNSDFDTATGRPKSGPIFTLVVDYTAPTFTVVRPTDGMKECRDDESNNFYQLLFTSLATDIDLDTILWEYKLAQLEGTETNWLPCTTSVMFDASTGTFAGAWDISHLASQVYDFRLTVADVAGNVTQLTAASDVVIDVTDPWGELTRVVVNGQDYFPTMGIDITAGAVAQLWVTAEDLEEGLPLHTGVDWILFQAAAVPDSGATVWHDIGLWKTPDDTIYEEVVASIDWNTSGEAEGNYCVRAIIEDEECNEYVTGAIALRISDIVPPRAIIAGFDPWQLTHGDDRTTYCDIYAYAYSDSPLVEVQFQYYEDENGDGIDNDSNTWVPIGLGRDMEDDAGDAPECDLWYATIDLRSFESNDILFRAFAKDNTGNQEEEADAPILATTLVTYEDGSLDLVASGLGEVGAPAFEIVGNDDEVDEVLVSVTMTHEDLIPYVMWTWPMPISENGGAECIEMTRMIDNPKIWRGHLHLPSEDCGKMTIFASTVTAEGAVAMQSTPIWSYEVTHELGSNGTIMVPGYRESGSDGYLYATANVPSGTGGLPGCLFLAPVVPPVVSVDQARFMTMLDRTAYYMGLVDTNDTHDITEGFWPTVTIEYDDAALLAACGGDPALAAEMEPYLTVRVASWNWWDGEWVGQDLSHITVDTEANRVSFKTISMCEFQTMYALFVPKWDAPVRVRSFAPSSPDLSRWNYTDRDPVIVVDLNSIGADEIDDTTIEVWIDGNLVATDQWVEGDGDLVTEDKNDDETLYQVTYTHSTDRAWWLTPGAHTLNVTYKSEDIEQWVSLPASAPGATFYVDATPPIIEFHGGWTNNPLLHNADGYINPYVEEQLMVKIIDSGSGVLVRPEELTGGADLLGMKYDLWLVHDEDDQVEVDEVEERLLLHTGTADELVPFITPPLHDGEGMYTLGDTLTVPLPIVAGGRTHDIQDGDILEVTLYSKKHVEQLADYTEGCDAGFVIEWNPFEDGFPDTLASVYWDCYVDHELGVHVYERGIQDWTGNAGSEFVEQRFVVDMTPPVAQLLMPADGVAEPSNDDFEFEVYVTDMHSGVSAASARLDGVSETDTTTITYDPATGRIHGIVKHGLALGHYAIVLTVTDRVGNHAELTIPLVVESSTLGLSETYIYPNPTNPADGAAQVHFMLSRHGDVTIKAYDFAGEYVGTLASRVAFDAGDHLVPWAGQAEDGTDLANGAYLIRIEAFDGAAHRGATVKAVIWRE